MDSFVDCIRGLEREIRELKSVLRARWERPMADEQRRHVFLRAKATELYVMVAFARGRLHVQNAPRGLSPGSAWDPHAWAALLAGRVTAAREKELAARSEPRVES